MKTYKFENFHEVEAAVICCLDPRFIKQTVEFVESELNIKKYDLHTYAGGPLCLCHSASQDLFTGNIKAASLELHHAPKIILISHQGCGGYKIVKGLEGEEALLEQIKDLHEIKENLQNKFNNIAIETYIMKMTSDTEVTFEKVE